MSPPAARDPRQRPGPSRAPPARVSMSDLVADLRRALKTRYDLQGELGSGGMSIVVRARDLRHNRDVAIKVLRGEFTATLGSDRFVREIQIAARLQHPHVLPLYDSGEAAGILYF